jgi:hypothetical protein
MRASLITLTLEHSWSKKVSEQASSWEPVDSLGLESKTATQPINSHHPKQSVWEADAKEVGVGNSAEETFN